MNTNLVSAKLRKHKWAAAYKLFGEPKMEKGFQVHSGYYSKELNSGGIVKVL